jgi:hypothetical protein
MPKIASMRLPCQKPCVSQCASSIVVQENAPITAAASMAHLHVSMIHADIEPFFQRGQMNEWGGKRLTDIEMNCNSVSFLDRHSDKMRTSPEDSCDSFANAAIVSIGP